MSKKQHPQKKRRIKNPVARCMELVTRPATHRDKTKYSRKDKKDQNGPFILDSHKYFNVTHLVLQERKDRRGMVACCS